MKDYREEAERVWDDIWTKQPFDDEESPKIIAAALRAAYREAVK